MPAKKKRTRRSSTFTWFHRWVDGLKQNKDTQKADFLLFFVVFLLSIFGLIMVFNASIVEANESFGDKFHYIKFQGAYLLLGWIILILISNIDYHVYKIMVRWLFSTNVLMLFLVLIPGIGLQLKGGRRWIDLGPITFQPTEPFKTILVVYLAKWLEEPKKLIHFLVLVCFVAVLVMLEPDMGTTIVLMVSAFIMYFVSGANMAKFSLVSLGALLMALVVIMSTPYRRQRLMTFLDPASDPLGSSYHVQQILFSLGSGGFQGLGLGQSKQKYQYLPEATTDSIFAIVGEETGFIGGVILLGLFVIVIWKGFSIAQRAPDIFGRLLATGITAWIGTQVFVNLASMVVLVPLTGIPLPFMSYGGTALVVTLTSVGILLNISKQAVPLRK